jgi:hypothetical protein
MGNPSGFFSGAGTEPDIINPANPLVMHFRVWNEYRALRESTKLLVARQFAELSTITDSILTITELKNAIEWALEPKK